jgi:hypothetical protein
MGVGLAIAGGLAAAGGAYAAHKQSEAAEESTEARREAAREQMDVQERIFRRKMELQEPFREVGYDVLPGLERAARGQTNALSYMGPEQRGVYNQLAAYTQQPLEENPAYQWQLGQAEEAINQAMAARGLHSSRPAINELANQRRALAGQFAQQRYNRLGQQYNMLQGTRANQFNRLAQLANVGQAGVAQSTQAAGQFANNMSNIYGQLGQARAQNAMRQGNIAANTIGQISSLPMQGMQTYMYGKSAGVF